MPATRGGNIEQLLLHAVARQNDRIDRLALAAMRGDSVAMSKALVIRRQSAATFYLNPTTGIDGGDGDQFAVCYAQSSITTIGGEQEPIARRHFNGFRLQHIEAPSVPPRDSGFLSGCSTNHDTVWCCTQDLNSLVLSNGADGPVKAQQLPWPIVLQISLLSGCPVERDVPGEGHTRAQLPACFPAFAYRLGHSVDLIVSRADDQSLACSIGIRIGYGRGSIGERDLTNGPHRIEFGESSLRVLAKRLHRGAIVFPALPLYLSQSNRLEARFLFQYSQGVACFHASDLFGIAAEGHP